MRAASFILALAILPLGSAAWATPDRYGPPSPDGAEAYAPGQTPSPSQVWSGAFLSWPGKRDSSSALSPPPAITPGLQSSASAPPPAAPERFNQALSGEVRPADLTRGQGAAPRLPTSLYAPASSPQSEPLPPREPVAAAPTAPQRYAAAQSGDAPVHVRFYSIDRSWGLHPDPIPTPVDRPPVLIGPNSAAAADVAADQSGDQSRSDASADSSAPY